MDLNLFLGCERVQNHLPGQWTFANTTRIQMERTHVRCYGNVAPPEGVAVRKHPHVSDITQAENGLHWPPTR